MQITYEQYLIEKIERKQFILAPLMMIRIMKKTIGITIRKYLLQTKNWTIW
ncbi:hypothetical protein G5716_05565 [Bacillus pacificus]|nr:hypothetical protein [Bacillus pacificus]